MTDISSLIAPTSTVPAAGTQILQPGEDHNDLGTDTFLKLLVAQLKYQDPTNPSDSTQFLAQTAQFTMVEKITQLTELAEKQRQTDQNLGAASLVGRNVTYIDNNGEYAQGQVQSARLGSEGPILMVDGWPIEFERIAEVSTPPVVTGTIPSPVTTPPAVTPPAEDESVDETVDELTEPDPVVVDSPVVRTPVSGEDTRTLVGDIPLVLGRPVATPPAPDVPRRLLDVDVI